MFANPLGLLALVAIPAIVALHLYRRRFQPHVVSALFLWTPEDCTPLAGRKREPLRRSLSLWSEIAAALLLALALAGPRGCASAASTHLVVVLDTSASMGASTAEGSLRERALAAVTERIARLPRGSRVSVVASGSPPRLLVGPAAFTEEALARLPDFAPAALRHDLGPALALALQLSNGSAVVVVSDRFDGDVYPADVELVAIGEPLDNVAISHAARASERHPDTGAKSERVFATLTSFARAPRSVTLTVRALDARRAPLVEPQSIELAAGERKSFAFDLPVGAPALELVIDADALTIDDRAYLAPSPPRTIALHSGLAPERAHALGLASDTDGRIDRWLALVDDSVAAPSAESAHLALADGVVGGPATWCLAFEALGLERSDLIGPFLAEKRHPLLEGLTLDGLVWSIDPAPRLSGSPLISAGNTSLLVESERDGRRVYTLNMDVERSSLQRSPDWPIFLSNLAEARRRELPGAERTSVLVGEDVVYRASDVGASDEPLVLTGEAFERSYPVRSVVVLGALERPGLYTLRRGERELGQIAVRFADAAESDLRDASSGVRAAAGAAASVAVGASWLDAALLCAALACVLLDWLVLARASGSLRGAEIERHARAEDVSSSQAAERASAAR